MFSKLILNFRINSQKFPNVNMNCLRSLQLAYSKSSIVQSYIENKNTDLELPLHPYLD